jgi:MFS family permease
LAFLVAFESLAVATVMPVVADELGGLELYALAFAAPIAVGIVSMTLAGPLMDRHGPATGLQAGVAVFVGGLLLAGLAPSMPVFLAGRAVQGLGMGFVGVALYVVIGRTFHRHDQCMGPSSSRRAVDRGHDHRCRRVAMGVPRGSRHRGGLARAHARGTARDRRRL